ncbi:hypothetical protein [Thalassoglobus polymorphus]|uniref:Bacterial type II secretion system protein G n=1 Tax=Thalassoglobus polymorphus TaxID=2527994 RepID=A0A517QLP6_9PLAN|nr:hypothetical protein [Thalassoglobus polymorphus]QDT32531.1 hypothetical protein Mal48_17780 [Thalassoglobus polymorphus]
MSDDSTKAGFFRSKRVFALCSLSVLAVVTLLVLFLLRGGTLGAKLTEIREKGLPTSPSELNDYYAVPAGVADRTDAWQKVFDLLENADLENRGQALPYIGNGPTPVPPPGEKWDQLALSRKFLVEHEQEIAAIHEAGAETGQIRFPLDFTLGNPLQFEISSRPRTIARLLSLDAHVSTHDGDSERTLNDIRSIFAISDALQGEVILVRHLLRNALHAMGISVLEEVFSHNDWTDEDLAALQESIRRADFRDELIFALHGERAISLKLIDMISFGPFRSSSKIELIRLTDRTVSGVEESWIAGIDRQKEIAAENTANRGKGMSWLKFQAVFALAPVYQQTVLSGARAVARQRCALVALAAKRHQLRHGRYPTSPQDIDKDLIGPGEQVEEILTDPFDGKPLRWISEDARLLVYSLGTDLKDDGGNTIDTDEASAPDVGFWIDK